MASSEAVLESRQQETPAGQTPVLPNDRLPSPYAELDKTRKEIRLLVVEPGTGEEPVRCAFKQAFLTEEPKPVYVTISYVWGDSAVRGSIFLQGHEFDVPASSERVLRRMRLPDKSRTLWIDAVCIHQNHAEERNHQVQVMGEIYTNTATNLIWLGKSTSSTESALASIHNIYEEMRSETEDFASMADTLYGNGLYRFSNKAIAAHVDNKALIQFFASAWFSRLWVCQEASLSSRNICHCGDHEIDLDRLLYVALWLRYKQGTPYVLRNAPGISAASLLARWQSYGFNSIHPDRLSIMTNLLFAFRNFKASDPKDHVYALLGLFQAHSKSNDIPLELVPDYKAPLADILCNATRFTIRERCDLECLRSVSHRQGDRTMSGLPTWVPRWDRAWDGERDSGQFPLVNRGADGGGIIDVDFTLSMRGILTAQGFVVDVLDSSAGIHPTLDRYSSVRDWNAFLDSAEAAIARDLRPQGLKDKLPMVLRAGATMPGLPADEDESRRSYAAYRRFLSIELGFPRIGEVSEDHAATADFHESMKDACYCRKFFTTPAGYMGLGPQTMMKGDIVAVLYGSQFPVILRPSASHAGEYESVGQTYVYGIMDGEAVEKHRAEGKEDEVFRIR